MNIVHLSPYYAPAYAFGGVARAVEGLARALAARGHQVTVLTTDAHTPTERYSGALETVEHGVTVARARNLSVWLRGKANLSTSLEISRTARDLIAAADVLHCHEFRTTENLLVTPLAARLGKPIILSPHGTLATNTGRSTLKIWWDRLLSPSVARRVHTVAALTKTELNEAQVLWAALGARSGFAVVPNGVNPDEFADLNGGQAFRQQWGIGADETVCLFLGRLHPRKGVDILIPAFKAANVPNSRLVIAGPDEGSLERIAPSLNQQIILTGYLDTRQRLAALAAADVFALPATGEGLSMAVLEAMAAGVPPILTPGCNLPEAGEAGAGIIVEPEIDALAAALRDLLTDPQRRHEMGARARQLIEQRFTWARTAEQMEGLYQRAIMG